MTTMSKKDQGPLPSGEADDDTPLRWGCAAGKPSAAVGLNALLLGAATLHMTAQQKAEYAKGFKGAAVPAVSKPVPRPLPVPNSKRVVVPEKPVEASAKTSPPKKPAEAPKKPVEAPKKADASGSAPKRAKKTEASELGNPPPAAPAGPAALKCSSQTPLIFFQQVADDLSNMQGSCAMMRTQAQAKLDALSAPKKADRVRSKAKLLTAEELQEQTRQRDEDAGLQHFREWVSSPAEISPGEPIGEFARKHTPLWPEKQPCAAWMVKHVTTACQDVEDHIQITHEAAHAMKRAFECCPWGAHMLITYMLRRVDGPCGVQARGLRPDQYRPSRNGWVLEPCVAFTLDRHSTTCSTGRAHGNCVLRLDRRGVLQHPAATASPVMSAGGYALDDGAALVPAMNVFLMSRMIDSVPACGLEWPVFDPDTLHSRLGGNVQEYGKCWVFATDSVFYAVVEHLTEVSKVSQAVASQYTADFVEELTHRSSRLGEIFFPKRVVEDDKQRWSYGSPYSFNMAPMCRVRVSDLASLLREVGVQVLSTRVPVWKKLDSTRFFATQQSALTDELLRSTIPRVLLAALDPLEPKHRVGLDLRPSLMERLVRSHAEICVDGNKLYARMAERSDAFRAGFNKGLVRFKGAADASRDVLEDNYRPKVRPNKDGILSLPDEEKKNITVRDAEYDQVAAVESRKRACGKDLGESSESESSSDDSDESDTDWADGKTHVVIDVSKARTGKSFKPAPEDPAEADGPQLWSVSKAGAKRVAVPNRAPDADVRDNRAAVQKQFNAIARAAAADKKLQRATELHAPLVMQVIGTVMDPKLMRDGAQANGAINEELAMYDWITGDDGLDLLQEGTTARVLYNDTKEHSALWGAPSIVGLRSEQIRAKVQEEDNAADLSKADKLLYVAVSVARLSARQEVGSEADSMGKSKTATVALGAAIYSRIQDFIAEQQADEDEDIQAWCAKVKRRIYKEECVAREARKAQAQAAAEAAVAAQDLELEAMRTAGEKESTAQARRKAATAYEAHKKALGTRATRVCALVEAARLKEDADLNARVVEIARARHAREAKERRETTGKLMQARAAELAAAESVDAKKAVARKYWYLSPLEEKDEEELPDVAVPDIGDPDASADMELDPVDEDEVVQSRLRRVAAETAVAEAAKAAAAAEAGAEAEAADDVSEEESPDDSDSETDYMSDGEVSDVSDEGEAPLYSVAHECNRFPEIALFLSQRVDDEITSNLVRVLASYASDDVPADYVTMFIYAACVRHCEMFALEPRRDLLNSSEYDAVEESDEDDDDAEDDDDDDQ